MSERADRKAALRRAMMEAAERKTALQQTITEAEKEIDRIKQEESAWIEDNKGRLSELIEALQILLKYGDPASPLRCSENLIIGGIDPATVSAEDKLRLKDLDFEDWGEGDFRSFQYSKW